MGTMLLNKAQEREVLAKANPTIGTSFNDILFVSELIVGIILYLLKIVFDNNLSFVTYDSYHFKENIFNFVY